MRYLVGMPLFDNEEPEGEVVPTTARLTRALLDDLDEIAQRETEARKKAGKRRAAISRNDVIERLLKDAVAAYKEREGLTKRR